MVPRMRADATSEVEQLRLPGKIEGRCGLPRGLPAQRRASGSGPRYFKLGHRTIAYRESDVRKPRVVEVDPVTMRPIAPAK
jgi:hypothetical protein